MTTTELIELLKKHEFGGATGRAREVSIQIGNDIYDTDIKDISTGDGLVTELYLTLSAELKKGEWVHDGLDFPHGCDWVHCSVCGKKGINVPADLTNFCPECGADMRGVEDET